MTRTHFSPRRQTIRTALGTLALMDEVLFILLLFIGSSHGAPSVQSTLPADFQDTLVAGFLGGPMDVAWTHDGRMLIATRNGQVRVYSNGVLLSNPAVDLSGVLCTQDERGLAGIAVHPNFSTNHYIYLYYTFKKFGTCRESEIDGPVNRLSRFTLANNNVVDPASELVLLDTPPLPTAMHNAGDLKFGKDGYLYVTVGDGGTACCSSKPNWPRDPGVAFGKILRLTESGSIPSANPFTGPGSARCNLDGVPPSGSPSGTKCQEVFAMGLRNPFRFSFDSNALEARFYINDVGENTWEEVDMGQSGADYGWPIREGPCGESSTTDCGLPGLGITNPIYWYGHNVTANGSSCTAITAGAFVPNGLWPRAFDGAYLYADFICGEIWSLTPDGHGGFNRADFASIESVGPVSMRFGPYGTSQALYYVTLGSGGQLRRIVYTGSSNTGTQAWDFRLDWADFDNDGTMTLQDAAHAVLNYDSPDPYWDYNLNGKVDIVDMAIMARYFASSFSSSPFPGQGQPTGTMEPSWSSQCSLLPTLDQNYCSSLP